MVVRRISLTSFRNFRKAELSPGRRFNVFHGMNGQGKTNLLEALFLLGTMKSFRQGKNRELILWGEQFSLLKGEVERDGVRREISLLVEKEGKKARVDRKSVQRLSDFFGCLNVVVFSPEELSMVRGAPETRRRYLDRAVFSADPGYLAAHQEYAAVLRNRNALLRTGSRDGLEVWTSSLVEAAGKVFEHRTRYVDAVSDLVTHFHSSISGSCEEVQCTHNAKAAGKSGDDYRERLLRLLTESAAEEFRRGTTLHGPHRDDLEFRLSGHPLRQHGSQGQQRTFVLALKMAEIEHLRRVHGDYPVLLLDDMTSELDRERNRNLMNFLEEREMQVFITTTHPDNLRIADSGNYRSFAVSNGTIEQ